MDNMHITIKCMFCIIKFKTGRGGGPSPSGSPRLVTCLVGSGSIVLVNQTTDGSIRFVATPATCPRRYGDQPFFVAMAQEWHNGPCWLREHDDDDEVHKVQANNMVRKSSNFTTIRFSSCAVNQSGRRPRNTAVPATRTTAWVTKQMRSTTLAASIHSLCSVLFRSFPDDYGSSDAVC